MHPRIVASRSAIKHDQALAAIQVFATAFNDNRFTAILCDIACLCTNPNRSSFVSIQTFGDAFVSTDFYTETISAPSYLYHELIRPAYLSPSAPLMYPLFTSHCQQTDEQHVPFFLYFRSDFSWFSSSIMIN